MLLPPPPFGSSARLRVCPAPAVVEAPPPGSQQPSSRPPLSPPLPRLSALCPRSFVRRRSFLLGNEKKKEKREKCLLSTEGWIRASTAEGRERFHRVFGPPEPRLMFTVSGNFGGVFSNPEAGVTEGADGGEEVGKTHGFFF